MPITKLIVQNFKGIADRIEFEIRPITIFVGPNSSGKSSCLHALTVLAQTLKIPNNTEPIVLDDDNASIHLGRFIEVVHSKSYKDEITLGVEVRVDKDIESWGQKQLKIGDTVRAEWSFKCSLRTQEIRLERYQLAVAQRLLTIRHRKKGEEYEVLDTSTNKKFTAEVYSAFFASLSPSGVPTNPPERDEYLATFEFLHLTQRVLRDALTGVCYLGPFREPPSRRYPTRGSNPSEVGSRGEATTTLLANEAVRSQTRPHTKKIGKWLQTLGVAKAVEVSRVGKSDLFDLSATLIDDETLPIADLGYGLSQALPVLAQCSFCSSHSLLLFEQPELHLHHGAAGALADVFADVANDKSTSVIAETHSEEMFQQTIRLVNRGVLQPSQVIAYDVERVNKASRFRRIELTEVEGQYEADHVWGRALNRVER